MLPSSFIYPEPPLDQQPHFAHLHRDALRRRVYGALLPPRVVHRRKDEGALRTVRQGSGSGGSSSSSSGGGGSSSSSGSGSSKGSSSGGSAVADEESEEKTENDTKKRKTRKKKRTNLHAETKQVADSVRERAKGRRRKAAVHNANRAFAKRSLFSGSRTAKAWADSAPTTVTHDID